MKKNKSFYELYRWIIGGSQRKLVLKNLTEEPETNQELRKRVNSKLPKDMKPLSLREMSRQLGSFVEKGLAECLSPESPYSRPYRISKKGLFW